MDGSRPNHIALPPPSPTYSPPLSPPPPTDDPFPSLDLQIHLPFDDDALSILEKIYLFSRSKAIFHRIFIAHALPTYLDNVSPQDAVEYVLPLLSGLAMDEDELVKEALAAELVPLIWWFFTHCQLTTDAIIPRDSHPSSSTLSLISVQAFTPILGTLLLSSNPLVGGAARSAVVHLLSRMKRADDVNAADPTTLPSLSTGIEQEDEDQMEWVTGLFGRHERSTFRCEILQQVVIGMGRLDVDVDDIDDVSPDHQHAMSDETVIGGDVPRQDIGTTDSFNPYFPLLASPFSAVSPTSSAAPQSSSSSFIPSLSASTSSAVDQSQPNIVERDHPVDITISDDWIPSAPRPSHRTLPPPRDPTPWSSPDISDSTHLASSPGSVPDSCHSHPEDFAEDDRFQDAYVFGSEDSEPDEQAAVGRLSSMSLMAAVAASGCLGDETEAFVTEVERVGRDPVYWVRREASFALGALAKVVPQEIVICSLLPLFDSLRKDSVWHVRHSALFALPAVLSRLPPQQRHMLALDTLLSLSTDDSAAVRSGVLEALGEVLYTFHQEEGGPPAQLVALFLGRKKDRCLPDGQHSSSPLSAGGTSHDAMLESFYNDPGRPLVCAFNFPAVALTLGRDRWSELRDVYLDIASDKTFKVQRTLAASLGELAKIIGEENAQRDLVGVWWDAVRCEEEDVRVKAVECVDDFVLALGSDAGANIIQRLVEVWDNGTLRGWKEREAVARALMSFARSSGGQQSPSLVEALLARALGDRVAAVRETAVALLSDLWLYWSDRADVVGELWADVHGFASSTSYRRRMTFVACLQALATPQGMPAIPLDDDFWSSVSILTHDAVVGVRIGVARLLGLISGSNFLRHLAQHNAQNLPGRLQSNSQPISGILRDLIQRLSQDESHEVRSYIPDPTQLGDFKEYLKLMVNPRTKARVSNLLTFSRPPPSKNLSQPVGQTNVNHRKADCHSHSQYHCGGNTDLDNDTSSDLGFSSPETSRWLSNTASKDPVGDVTL